MTQFPPAGSGAGFGPPPVPARTNVAAIISLICGLLGCVPVLTSLTAVILGVVGLSQAKRPAGSGKGLAVAGLVLGVIGLVGWGALIVLIAMAPGRLRELRAQRVELAMSAVTARGVATPPGAMPAPPDKYELLIGEGLAGSGFLISYGGYYWAVCSLHQFDRETPSSMIQLEGDDIELDAQAVIRQRDVQVIGVSKAPASVQFLAYEPRFSLARDMQVIIFGPAGERIDATIVDTSTGLSDYRSTAGPRVMEARMSKPFGAQGGSGGPVVLKQTGQVVGVLIGANDAENATMATFETLCLPERAN